MYNALRYSNRELTAFDWGWGSTISSSLVPFRDNTENLVMSVVDAIIAEIGKNKVKARPQTKNASFKLRRAAKKLDRFLYGEAKRLDLWERAKMALHDACWGEVGAVVGDICDDGIVFERVFPDELIIDNDACFSEPTPIEVIRRRAMPLAEVLGRWGKFLTEEERELLAEDARADVRWTESRTPGPSYLIVTESHRLPVGSGEDMEPGRHAVGTRSVTLKDEPWDESWLPYRFFHWMRPLAGFFCPSAVEQADPYQRRLDEINAVIRDAQDLMARPRIWLPLGSKLQQTHFDNRIGRVLTSALKPEPLTWSAIPAELYNERERLVRTCFEYFGLTQLSAQGKLPQSARLDSSEALREYNTIQDNRLADLAQRYEAYQRELYCLIIDLSERAYKKGKRFKTTWVGGRRVEEVNWADIDLERDRYVIQIEPASVMPETPAARVDFIMKLAQSGMVSREEVLMMLQSGDIQREVGVFIAELEDGERVMELIESGDYEPPSGIQGLIRLIPRIRAHALNLRCEYPDVDQDILDNFELWLASAQWILDTAAEEQTQAPSMGMPSTPGMPPAPGGLPAGMPGGPGPGAMPGGAMSPPQVPM